MQETTQVMKVGPVAHTRCVGLFSLVHFVAKAFEVEVDRQEWHRESQNFIVSLYGRREGIMQVCIMVQQGYPDLRVTLEALDEQGSSPLN